MKIKKLSKTEKIRRYHRYVTNWHRKFAWLPVRVTDEEVIWLDHYYRKAAYMSGSSPSEFDNRSKEDYLVSVLTEKESD